MEEGRLEDANILVRPHLGYQGDTERFSSLQGKAGIAIDTSDKQNHALRDHFDTSMNHVYNLYNSLYHADVCVNVASTLSLDAAACGTPVINFNFDAEEGIASESSVKRLFVSDYVKHLMASGGTWLAKSKGEFLEMLQDVLEKGKQKDIQKMVQTFMYKLDGKSAERIADVLLKILNPSARGGSALGGKS